MIKFIKKYFKIKKLQYFKLHYTDKYGYEFYKYINLYKLKTIKFGVGVLYVESLEPEPHTPFLIIDKYKYYFRFYQCSSEESAINVAKTLIHTILLQRYRYNKTKYYD